MTVDKNNTDNVITSVCYASILTLREKWIESADHPTRVIEALIKQGLRVYAGKSLFEFLEFTQNLIKKGYR